MSDRVVAGVTGDVLLAVLRAQHALAHVLAARRRATARIVGVGARIGAPKGPIVRIGNPNGSMPAAIPVRCERGPRPRDAGRHKNCNAKTSDPAVSGHVSLLFR